ncbi:MAG TPA: hydrogenase-1 expression HyaE [Gammaproteobacteria bacterium]|jgi:hydrogenase-1 operon protein HyaE|nr:hydrogenase-1 expression HyaE [Gammaproteobacteria bacterium]
MNHPLIDRLIDEFHYPLVDADNHDSILRDATVCLFFSGDPKRYPEATDVAVVLPELAAAFEGQFTPAVVSRDVERQWQTEYGFNQWPALVFLRNGQYLGAICKIRDWADYKDDIPAILAHHGKRSPGIGIPVTTQPA